MILDEKIFDWDELQRTHERNHIINYPPTRTDITRSSTNQIINTNFPLLTNRLHSYPLETLNHIRNNILNHIHNNNFNIAARNQFAINLGQYFANQARNLDYHVIIANLLTDLLRAARQATARPSTAPLFARSRGAVVPAGNSQTDDIDFSQLVDVPRSHELVATPMPGEYSQRIEASNIDETDIPENYFCIMGMHVMTNPVRLNGRIYDEPYISAWLARNSTDPFSRAYADVSMFEAMPELRQDIERFVIECEAKAIAVDNNTHASQP